MDIILVDDEEIIHKTLGSFLARAGHSVRKALNGVEALGLLEQGAPDLIISDVRMPVMDGLQLVERFSVRAPATPIVLITGHGDEDTAIAALQKGAYDYLRKPVRLEQLFGLVERLEERRRMERAVLAGNGGRSPVQRQLTVSALAAGIAHEICNPATLVSGNAQLLRQQLRDLDLQLRRVLDGHPHAAALMSRVAELQPMLEGLQAGAERVARIVQQIQAFSSRRPHESPCPVDLSRCLETAVRQAARACRGLRVERQWRTAWVHGVAHELTEIFANLVLNAAQAARERPCGRIGVELSSCESGWVTVAVEDNGPGVADEIADRIFDPFFTTRRPGSGMGLGLAVCQSLVNDHGGHLGFTSTPGAGARFWVRLPAHDGTAGAPGGTAN